MRAAGLFAPGNGAGGSISANNGPAGPGATLNFCGAGLTCGTKILSSRLCRPGFAAPGKQASGLRGPEGAVALSPKKKVKKTELFTRTSPFFAVYCN